VFTDKINIVMHHSSQGMYKKNILSKSLNIEVLKSTAGVLLIFFFLVVSSRFVGYFEQASEGLIDPKSDYELLFENGSLTAGIFSNDAKMTSSFKKFEFPVANKQTDTRANFENIFSSINIDDSLGFQWSISLSITILVLMVIAIYIGKVEPRQGRLSVILPGMLIYIFYLSLLLLGRDYIAQNDQTQFNLIFTHLIFILFAIMLYLKDKFFISIISNKSSLYKTTLATISILFILWTLL